MAFVGGVGENELLVRVECTGPEQKYSDDRPQNYQRTHQTNE